MIYTYNGNRIAHSDGKLLKQESFGTAITYPKGFDLSKVPQSVKANVVEVIPTAHVQSLDEVYQAKLAEISNARREASNSTFMHAGKTFSANQLAKESIVSTHGEVLAIDAMPPNWVGAWVDVNSDPYPITTVADWKAFYNSYYSTGLAHAGKAGQLIGQVKAIYEDPAKDGSTKISEINALGW